MSKKELMRLYTKAAECEARSEAAIINESISEAELDAIVDAECDALDALENALVKFGNGMLSSEDANVLVYKRLHDVGALIARLAGQAERKQRTVAREAPLDRSPTEVDGLCTVLYNIDARRDRRRGEDEMSRKEMIEAIVNDQIKNGVVRPEDKQRQIDARLKGCGAARPMSYAECERVYAEYFKK